MKKKWIVILNILMIAIVASCNQKQEVVEEKKSTKEEVIAQIEKTGLAVREAFAKGDIESIKLYHHPDVQKALSYMDIKNGREEVLQGLKGTMENFDLRFLDEKATEVFLYFDDVVVKQMRFGLELIPKNGDDPFVFRGRTLIVLQRSDESPTGWATIHEIIQPYQE
ncbi:hypothetical protein [Croceitalea rosinachiae]|uniref:SnoaL-like domain-containing protein n=1 Tax=Croceitalea rosinachiae TaxID=3075596 RepID=A0ABU3ADB7_9FLAO|nr:hypothetical protein [Croceitalea sp. F388]MDT0607502.1 hypothetical protein [Croceitalea sp. F388]